jgi:hypothetical protein
MYHSATMQTAYQQSVREKIGKVMADAFYTALAAFLLGLCVAGAIKRFDTGYFAGAVFCGPLVAFAAFRTRGAIQRLLTAKYTLSETAKKNASQVKLWCFLLAAYSFLCGHELMASFIRSNDSFYPFAAFFFYGALTALSIYLLRREARLLTSALA